MNLPKIALGAWAWENDGTFGVNYTEEDKNVEKRNEIMGE